MSRILSVLLKCIFVTVPAVSLAQKVTLKESETVISDYLHEFFVLAPDKYIAVNYASPHSAFSLNRNETRVEVAAYDKNLQQTYSTEVKAIKGKKYETGLVQNGQLYMFMSEDKKKVARYRLNSADDTATQEEDAFEIRNGKEYAFSKGYSRDSSYSYVLCGNTITKTESITDGVIMDKQMKVVTRFSTSMTVDRENFQDLQYILSNNGTLSMVMITLVKKPEGFRPRKYEVIQIDKAGKSTHTDITDIPELSIADIIWQTGDEPLSFTATIARSAKTGLTAIINGLLDVQQKKIVVRKTMEFSQCSVFNTATTDENLMGIAKEGLPITAKVKIYYQYQDKSVVMALEAGGSNSYSRSSGSSFYYNYTNSWSFDIYVFKLTADLQLEWFQDISKNQLEPVYPTFTGFITVKDKKEGIHFFFQETPSNTEVYKPKNNRRTILEGQLKRTSLTDVYITSDGKATKKFVANNDDISRYMSPQNAIISNNMIIYDAFKRRNAGASSYAIARIIAE